MRLSTGQLQKVGFVVIGRNEGERLKVCLQSLSANVPAVYVDSGSTDGSIEFARSLGLDTVMLDTNIGFTAARARNAGFKRLISNNPSVAYVQFADGDCEMFPNWLASALVAISEEPTMAIVAGRLRERFPESSIFNALINLEWNSPIGVDIFCGGNALVRRSALEKVNGYREDLIAGEEPDLCLRLKSAGWKYCRIDADMALHDAAIFSFRQWWNRSRRTGFAYAQGAQIHGAEPHHHWEKETRSALIWGFGLPIATFLLTLLMGVLGCLTLLLYGAQILRIAVRPGTPGNLRFYRAFFLVFGKFPEALGVFQFLLGSRSQKVSRLIEYK
jgi:GT2 family glycosyltransferase